MTRIHSFGPTFGLVLCLLGCGTEIPDRTPPPASESLRPLEVTVDYDAFSAALQVAASVRPGQPVPMELVVRNESNRALYLGTGDSATTFDFVIRDRHGSIVWNRMHGREALLVLMEHTLAPGQELRFSDVWKQQSNDGAPIPPGTYEVRAALDTNEPDDLKAPPRTLVIDAPRR